MSAGDRFPLERVPAAVADIARRLREAGHEAWYVGGAVRDVLIAREHGRRPRRAGDFDIATSAAPEAVRALFRRTVPVGIEHGTVAVLDEAGLAHEVTTFRRDVKTDGRHAVVEFGASLEEDLARRDFTINAVAVNPETGAIVDPRGGRDDLARGLVRAVGDPATRFREDRLRVLRGLRFAAAFAFTIEPATWAALAASAGELGHLSRERVRDEWLKSLGTSVPSVVAGLWRRAGVLGAVWPELAGLPESRDARLDGIERAEPVLITAAALWHAGASAEAARAAVVRLRFSNRDVERVAAIVAGLAEGLPPVEGEPLRRWLARHRAHAEDIVAAAEPPEARAAVHEGIRAALAARAPLSVHDLAVTGNDLQAAGIPAGPRMGEILRTLLDEVLKDPAGNTRDHLIARAKALA